MARTVKVAKLTLGQIERMETIADLPISRWKRAPSEARLKMAVRAVLDELEPDDVRAMTLEDIAADDITLDFTD